jgi:hypothetical protein
MPTSAMPRRTPQPQVQQLQMYRTPAWLLLTVCTSPASPASSFQFPVSSFQYPASSFQLQFTPISSLIGALAAAGRRAFSTLT